MVSGIPIDPNSEDAFSGENMIKPSTCLDYPKTIILAKEKLKNNVPFGKWKRNIYFHVASLRRKKMTILILHFLRVRALNIFIYYCFVIRINKIAYSKLKMGCFVQISVFFFFFFATIICPQHVYPDYLHRVAFKWLLGGVTLLANEL